MNKQEPIKDFLDSSSITADVLLENEKKTNRLLTIIQSAISALLIINIIVILISEPSVYDISIIVTLAIVILINVAVIIVVIKLKYHKAMKFILIGLLIFTAIFLKHFLGVLYNFWAVLPIVLASTYNNKKISLGSSIISIVLFYLSDIVTIFIHKYNNFNIIVFPKAYEIVLSKGLERNELIYNLDVMGTFYNYVWIFVPASLFLLIVLAFACYIFAKRNHENLINQSKAMEEKMRTDEELSFAKNMQTTMIPLNFESIINQCKNIDIYGLMLSAEDVSSDAYDFFMIDDNHLCVFIGETSARGTKATIFMDKAKDRIKDYALKGYSVSDILTNVNNNLCVSNATNLCLTAWIGILDISTGKMKYSSAGQNQQYKSFGGSFKAVNRTEKDVLLGAIDDIKYEELSLIFEKGDKLFLYTDGVITGTNNEKELYGSERLLKCINSNITDAPKDLLINVQNEILEFVVEGTQSDDITMLCIEYK